MRRTKMACKSIQRTLAAGGRLNPAQQLHLEHCSDCATVARRFQQLDTLVSQVTADPVPAGFSDRLMARIPREPSVQIDTYIPVCDKLLVAFTQSRLLRNIAISLGMALGIGQLVQLILGIFFVSMMAAM